MTRLNQKKTSSSWRKHEVKTEEATQKAIGKAKSKVRMKTQMKTTHSGKEKRYDIHVAQRRRGGKSVVIDAKDFRAPLPKRELQDALEYKKGGRASGVAIVLSAKTPGLTNSAWEFAWDNNIEIIRENQSTTKKIRSFIQKHLDTDK